MMVFDFGSVLKKYHDRNKILFDRESPCIAVLLSGLAKLDRKRAIMWSLDCVETTIDFYEANFGYDPRLNQAYESCKSWARGDIKMPVAKETILAVHGIAKETDNPVKIALAHAIGQALSCIHTSTHAPGLIFYELTGLVHKHGINDFEPYVSEKIQFYEERLDFWSSYDKIDQDKWAKFIKE